MGDETHGHAVTKRSLTRTDLVDSGLLACHTYSLCMDCPSLLSLFPPPCTSNVYITFLGVIPHSPMCRALLQFTTPSQVLGLLHSHHNLEGQEELSSEWSGLLKATRLATDNGDRTPGLLIPGSGQGSPLGDGSFWTPCSAVCTSHAPNACFVCRGTWVYFCLFV